MKLLQRVPDINSFVLRSIRKNFSTPSKSPACCTPDSDTPGPKTLVPGNCREQPAPIATAQCRVAVVVGGANNGFGFAAAEQLLHHGARRVVLADGDVAAGELAARRLCAAYGRGRAVFYQCDVKNSCHIEGIFKSSPCKDEKVSILFNDLDAVQRLPESRMNYCGDAVKLSNAQRITRLAIDLMRPPPTCPPTNLVINCSSILGFMGWPDDPDPVYCLGSEATIQTTRDLAVKFPAEQTGVRLVSLCPTSTLDIALPDFPDQDDDKAKVRRNKCPRRPCAPDPTKDCGRVGAALAHILARAQTGSTWLLGPPYVLHRTPRLVPCPEQQLKPDEEECPGTFSFLTKILPTGNTKTPSSSSSSSSACPENCKTKNPCWS